MNSNVVSVAKSPFASARAVPVQFVKSPCAILRRVLHIAGKLDRTDSTARFLLAHLVSLNRFRVKMVLCSSFCCSASKTFKSGKLLVRNVGGNCLRQFRVRGYATSYRAKGVWVYLHVVPLFSQNHSHAIPCKYGSTNLLTSSFAVSCDPWGRMTGSWWLSGWPSHRNTSLWPEFHPRREVRPGQVWSIGCHAKP